MSQAASNNPPPTKRRSQRQQVYRTVSWSHRSGEDQGGALCDVSAGGTFLAPFGCGTDNIREGDTVWIVLQADGERQTMGATVRWHGWSERHACRGFGVEFDTGAKQQAEHLLLDVDSEGVFFVPT